jgi:hypothetical protein
MVGTVPVTVFVECIINTYRVQHGVVAAWPGTAALLSPDGQRQHLRGHHQEKLARPRIQVRKALIFVSFSCSFADPDP